MRDASEANWWRKSRRLALVITGGGAALSAVALGFVDDGPPFLDLPSGTLVALTIAPLAVMAAAFVFAGRQRRLDRDYDVAED